MNDQASQEASHFHCQAVRCTCTNSCEWSQTRRLSIVNNSRWTL